MRGGHLGPLPAGCSKINQAEVVVTVLKQETAKIIIQGMSRAMNQKISPDRAAEHEHVSQKIQNLVPNRLVIKAHPFGIDHIVLVKNQGVLKGTTPGEAASLQRLNVPEKPESSGPRNFLNKYIRIKDQGLYLPPDPGVSKINCVSDLQTIIGTSLDPLATLLIPDGFLQGKNLFSDILRPQAGLMKEKDKGGRTSVENRNLRPADFDNEIVDAHALHSSQKMLHGRDLGISVADGRGQASANDTFRPQRKMLAFRAIDLNKEDTRIRIGRPESQFNLLATVQPNSRTTH